MKYLPLWKFHNIEVPYFLVQNIRLQISCHTFSIFCKGEDGDDAHISPSFHWGFRNVSAPFWLVNDDHPWTPHLNCLTLQLTLEKYISHLLVQIFLLLPREKGFRSSDEISDFWFDYILRNKFSHCIIIDIVNGCCFNKKNGKLMQLIKSVSISFEAREKFRRNRFGDFSCFFSVVFLM